MTEEMLDIINPLTGEVTGQALRSKCHGDNTLWHRAVHVLVFHPETGDILLQKRSRTKRIQPGKWDASVGGHISAGESIAEALLRETEEEIGLHCKNADFKFLFEYEIHNEIESELATVFRLESDGPFSFPADEIEELRFFPVSELKQRFADGNTDDMTPILQKELAMLDGFLS
ncbi:MAG: NUDIX domain-containing protein [Lentisphaeria bacterium]|nr:NUDIX domain-containing protein [Lentisphaeria bacterium]